MSLRNTMIEEAYEAVDAIERDDTDALCEELGDVLLQIVFHAQIETEASDFTIRDVTTGIVKSLCTAIRTFSARLKYPARKRC